METVRQIRVDALRARTSILWKRAPVELFDSLERLDRVLQHQRLSEEAIENIANVVQQLEKDMPVKNRTITELCSQVEQ